jgi:hypothetical protein
MEKNFFDKESSRSSRDLTQMKQRNYYDNVEDSFLFKKSGFPNEHSTISKKNRSEQSDHIIDPVKAIESQHADKLAADEA